MTDEITLEVQIDAPPSEVYRALTDDEQLSTWFAEHAAVSLKDLSYGFWGRLGS